MQAIRATYPSGLWLEGHLVCESGSGALRLQQVAALLALEPPASLHGAPRSANRRIDFSELVGVWIFPSGHHNDPFKSRAHADGTIAETMELGSRAKPELAVEAA